MKYEKHGCENTKPTPYGDYAEQQGGNTDSKATDKAFTEPTDQENN